MPSMITVSHDEPLVRTFMLFMQLASAATKYVDAALYKDARLSLITYISLKGLKMNGGWMTHSAMARWTNTKKHNITALVDRMKQEGLVTTERNQKDGRVIHIKVTEKGIDAHDQANPTARKIMQDMMRGIDEDRAADLEKLLNTIRTNIEQN